MSNKLSINYVTVMLLFALTSFGFVGQSYAAAVPFTKVAKSQSDKIFMIPQQEAIKSEFQELQQQLFTILQARTRPIPGLYSIKVDGKILNISNNHKSGIPMVPHIKLKSIVTENHGRPTDYRQRADHLLGPEFFAAQNIPSNFYFTKFAALRNSRKANEIIIVAILAVTLIR